MSTSRPPLSCGPWTAQSAGHHGPRLQAPQTQRRNESRTATPDFVARPPLQRGVQGAHTDSSAEQVPSAKFTGSAPKAPLQPKSASARQRPRGRASTLGEDAALQPALGARLWGLTLWAPGSWLRAPALPNPQQPCRAGRCPLLVPKARRLVGAHVDHRRGPWLCLPRGAPAKPAATPGRFFLRGGPLEVRRF